MENMVPAGHNETGCTALQAEGPRFEPATAHHEFNAPASFGPLIWMRESRLGGCFGLD
jgi:hypothetical protein